MHRRQFLQASIVSGFGLTCLPATAQIPNQTIRIIFPFAAGSSGDSLTRLIAEELRAGLNQAVIVENRTGAGGRLGIQAAKNAASNGKTLLMAPIAPMSVYQHVYKSLAYDPIKDFQPIAQIATFDFCVAVGAQIPAKSVTELVAWAQANAEQANYGTPAAGTLPHFFAVLFEKTTGLKLQHVSFRGGAAALNALVGGQIPILFMSTDSLIQMHKAGRIRILATSDNQRSSFLPEVPTFREQGYDITGRGWFGMFAPAGTPPETIDRLNKLVVAAVRSLPVQKRISALGLRPTGTTAPEFASIQQADSALWAPAVKASGFTLDN